MVDASDRRHLDAALDEALEETFPASDAIAITPGGDRTPEQRAVLAALDRGIAESDEIQRGGPPTDSSVVLRQIYSHLHYYLLKEQGLTMQEVDLLLAERDRDPAALNASEGIQLAVDLLSTIKSALRIEGKEFTKLIFGRAGVKAAEEADRAQRRRVAGGLASGRSRARQKQADLDRLAASWNALRAQNDVKNYTLDDIARNAGVEPTRARYLRRRSILERAEKLRK